MIRSVLRDSVIYGGAAVLSRGVAIILLPIYTRVLSPSEYGAFDLIVTLGVLANLIVALEVSQGLARFWADSASDSLLRWRLASTALSFTVFMYACFLLISLLFSSSIANLIFSSGEYLLAFRFALFFVAVNGVYLLLVNQFRWELRSGAYALVSALYALSAIFFVLLFGVIFDFGLVGVIFSQLVSALLGCVLCIFMLRSSFGLYFDVLRLKEMLRFSAPLVPAALAIFITLYINRIALNYFGSLEDVAAFGVASRIAGLVGLVTLAVQSGLTPLVYEHYRDPETALQIARLFRWFLGVAFPLCASLSLFGDVIILVFATSDFMSAGPLVGLLAFSVFLSQIYIFFPGIVIAKKTERQLLVALGSALCSIVANLLLVPVWGSLGAALATLLSAGVFFGLWFFLSQPLYRIPIQWRNVFIPVIFLVFSIALNAKLHDSDFPSVLIIFTKVILLAFVFILVVSSGLITRNDLRNLVGIATRKFWPS